MRVEVTQGRTKIYPRDGEQGWVAEIYQYSVSLSLGRCSLAGQQLYLGDPTSLRVQTFPQRGNQRVPIPQALRGQLLLHLRCSSGQSSSCGYSSGRPSLPRTSRGQGGGRVRGSLSTPRQISSGYGNSTWQTGNPRRIKQVRA